MYRSPSCVLLSAAVALITLSCFGSVARNDGTGDAWNAMGGSSQNTGISELAQDGPADAVLKGARDAHPPDAEGFGPGTAGKATQANIGTSAIPEPSTVAILIGGATILGLRARRRRLGPGVSGPAGA